MYYRVVMLHGGRQYRIMDTLYLDEAIDRVTGESGRWPGLVRGAVVTDSDGRLVDPRKYGGRGARA